MSNVNEHNARAHAIYREGAGSYHNASAQVLTLEVLIRQHQDELDQQIRREYPVNTLVKVENLHHPNRYILGPVVGYTKASDYRGPGILVRNTTNTVRHVHIHSMIFKVPV